LNVILEYFLSQVIVCFTNIYVDVWDNTTINERKKGIPFKMLPTEVTSKSLVRPLAMVDGCGFVLNNDSFVDGRQLANAYSRLKKMLFTSAFYESKAMLVNLNISIPFFAPFLRR
jgi:hypothetical protein